MCCAGLGTLSVQEMTTGRVSHQQISPIKGQIVIYRPSVGPDSLLLSGKSRIDGFAGSGWRMRSYSPLSDRAISQLSGN